MLHKIFRRKLATMLVLASVVSACGPIATGPLQTDGYADRTELRNYAESIRGYNLNDDEPIDALIVIENQYHIRDSGIIGWVSVGVVNDRGIILPVPSRIKITNLNPAARDFVGLVRFVGTVDIISPKNSLLLWWGADTVELQWSQILESDIGNLEPLIFQSPDTSRPLNLPMSGRKVDSVALRYRNVFNKSEPYPLQYVSLHPDTDPFVLSSEFFPDTLPLRSEVVLTRFYYHVIIAPNGKRIGVLQNVRRSFTLEW